MAPADGLQWCRHRALVRYADFFCGRPARPARSAGFVQRALQHRRRGAIANSHDVDTGHLNCAGGEGVLWSYNGKCSSLRGFTFSLVLWW